MNPNWRKNNLAIPKPARIHSPDPFLRAGNAVSVLPNPNPQKNSFGKTESEELALRIPSVSPLEKPDLARHHHTEKKKTESAEHKTECVVARRGRNGTAEAEEHAPSVFWSGCCSVTEFVVERTIYISHYHFLGTCHIGFNYEFFIK